MEFVRNKYIKLKQAGLTVAVNESMTSYGRTLDMTLSRSCGGGRGRCHRHLGKAVPRRFVNGDREPSSVQQNGYRFVTEYVAVSGRAHGLMSNLRGGCVRYASLFHGCLEEEGLAICCSSM